MYFCVGLLSITILSGSPRQPTLEGAAELIAEVNVVVKVTSAAPSGQKSARSEEKWSPWFMDSAS